MASVRACVCACMCRRNQTGNIACCVLWWCTRLDAHTVCPTRWQLFMAKRGYSIRSIRNLLLQSWLWSKYQHPVWIIEILSFIGNETWQIFLNPPTGWPFNFTKCGFEWKMKYAVYKRIPFGKCIYTVHSQTENPLTIQYQPYDFEI